MKEIILSNGGVALVDDEDFVRLSQFSWNKANKTGYAGRYKYLGVNKYKNQSMHREVLNAEKGFDVDHKNGNKLDNRKENLRICTRTQNHANRRVSRSATGLKGVHFVKKTGNWRALIYINNGRKHLGCFSDKVKAAEAYDLAAIALFGEFAATNKELGLI